MRNRLNRSRRPASQYEVFITEKALSLDREPVDDVDFFEFEDDEDVRDLTPARRAAMQIPKRVYAIVGPDLSNLSDLTHVNVQLATI